jgi:hypothetical protein
MQKRADSRVGAFPVGDIRGTEGMGGNSPERGLRQAGFHRSEVWTQVRASVCETGPVLLVVATIRHYMTNGQH